MNGPSDTPVREAPRTEVLVINLADAKDRMAFQEAQMAELGLNATRVDAVAKQAIPEEELADYSRRAPRPLVEKNKITIINKNRTKNNIYNIPFW